MLEVTILPILSDNYCYILRCPASGLVAVIDPGEAKPVEAYLERKGLGLDYIFLTHHHWDHKDGVATLKQKFAASCFGSQEPRHPIEELDRLLRPKERFSFGETSFEVLDTSGHTLGHIAYFCAEELLLFSGDALFVMGSGRLLEGSAELAFASFERIKALPPKTKIYCGHNYSLANAAFAQKLFPENEAIAKRKAQLELLHQKGELDLPTTLAQERESNPYMLAKSAQDFARIRALKDRS